MDNAEKLQDVSDNVTNETTEEVQHEAELSAEEQAEVNEETSEVEGPKEEKTEDSIDQPDNADNKESSETPESPEEKAEAEPHEASTLDMSEPTEDAETSDVVGEEHETTEDEEEHEEALDFDHASRDEVIAKLREVKKEENIRSLDRVLRAIKPRFDELYEISKNEALQKFVSQGSEPDAFEYHGDEIDREFFTLYGQLRTKRNKHYKDLESQKEINLKKKEHLLEELRKIVDGEESSNSINSVRDLQSEWKKTGSVPGALNKTLWANYNALLDRYYDNRSIYFELKDLDRKKNLTLKEELCEKAEVLNELEDMKSAIVQLNDLHDEYKHIGPVPKEDQEPLWQRFKAASDAIYAKRKDYFEELKAAFDANLVKKQELIQKLEKFTTFSSDRITKWNGKTRELLGIQKQWEAIGGVPRGKAKETNKAFWNSFKTFFAKKNQFFKELESKRVENLNKKHELIAKAEYLKDSKDWNSTADKLKHLQAQWKDIGPVPEKVRNETYKKFKTACDHFFNKRRDQNKGQFKAYENNLQLKLQICDRLEAACTGDNVNLDDVYDLIDNYTSVGFVPRNAIKKIRHRFDALKDKLLNNTSIDEIDRVYLKNHISLGELKNSPGGVQKINQKEHTIKRKISSLENDISTWNTNMEFLSNSHTAAKLKADMQTKINKAEDELEDLKSQLAIIYSQN